MKSKINISVLGIIYAVGILGFHSKYFGLFSVLSPITLILSFLALYITSAKTETLKFRLFLTFIIGLLVEIIGVKTGLPFGTYLYLEGLGSKILGVPWVMGLNWLVLSWSAGQICAFYFQDFSKILRCSAAVILLLSVDLLMEPVAVDLRFWIFSGSGPGILNYIGWALTSALIQWILVDKIPSVKNNTASAIIIFQIIFFASFQFWPLN